MLLALTLALAAVCPGAENPADPKAQSALARKHFLGDGVKQDYREAFRLYSLAAEQGDAEGQNGVGACYAKGAGVRQDDREAARWFRLAAEQGLDKAQLNLADSYREGIGVERDRVAALTWTILAAAGGSRDGLAAARSHAERMRASEVFLARAAARRWLEGKRPGTDLPDLPPGNFGRLVGFGTGFFVTRDGDLLTCHHVCANGNALWVRTRDGVLLASAVKGNAAADLALLAVDARTPALALADSAGVQLGQTVFTVGFPNADIQGVSPKMTRGEVSSLAGVRDDPSAFQISVPVQPGNSGGPLADAEGNVVGVVSSKINPDAMLERGRLAPENVNYAVKISRARELLGSARGVAWKAADRPPGGKHESLTAAVREVEEATVLILVYRE